MKTRKYAGGMGVFAVLWICLAWAGTGLRVNEEATRLVWRDSGYMVSLVVQNPSVQSINSTVTVELVSPSERVFSTARRARVLKPGRNVVELPLDLGPKETLPSDSKEMLWQRLRYAVKAEDVSLEGIIAVGQITPDAFELHAYARSHVRPGEPFVIQVRAIHPVTRQAVTGVQLEGYVDDGDTEEAGSAWKVRKGSTDHRGYATLKFPLPAEAFEESELDWGVRGWRGAFSDEVDDSSYVARRLSLLLLTDKPMYQPGQKLRMRLLALDAMRRPAAKQEFAMEVEDPEGTTVFRETVSTSRFGVGHAEWEIPASLRLGDYVLKATAESKDSSGEFAYQRVKISRYDLPAFTVETKPDRAFYLPGQDAQVEVRAKYLFGKAVDGGTVRVVREASRAWNYHQQRWVSGEEESYTGDVSQGGVFRAAIALGKYQEELARDRSERFVDLNYAAYFTDRSTGRTEQRRFSLRVTREPIHVYVIGGSEEQSAGFPLSFYVSTSYADGRPAACQVEIRAVQPAADEGLAANNGLSVRLAALRTNRFGVARVAGLDFSPLEDREPRELELRANDGQGAGGLQLHDLSPWDAKPVLRVETNKAIYAPGEAIEVQLRSNVANTTVRVEATAEGGASVGQLVRLRRGKAFAVFAPSPILRGEVRVLAYALGLPASDDWEQRTMAGSRVVIFPAPKDLTVNLRAEKGEYRPGEKALMNVAVRGPRGMTSESALGVVVFDRAVEERARVEMETGNGGGAPDFRTVVEEFLGYRRQLGGVRVVDVQRLDMTKPLPEGLDLVAEILLQQNGRETISERSTRVGGDPAQVFAQHFRKAVDPVEDALDDHYDATGEFPRDEEQLQSVLARAKLSLGKVRDPWGTALGARGDFRGPDHTLELLSLGPDKARGTEDDLVVKRIERKWFQKTGEQMERAAAAFYARNRHFVRDEATLASALAHAGMDWASLRDPWGHRLRARFDVDTVYYTVVVESPGEDGKFGNHRSWEDVHVWTIKQDYTNELRIQLDHALWQFVEAKSRFPETEEEVRNAFREAGVPPEVLLDPWMRPYSISVKSGEVWGDRVQIRMYSEDGPPKLRGRLEPVTRSVRRVELRSNGPDGLPRTPDDVFVLSFSRMLTERTGRATIHPPAELILGGIGAITGEVTDATGAVIAGATVTATHGVTKASRETKSGDDGRYTLHDLPTGHYSLRVESAGFRSLIVQQVPVRSSAVTRVDARLEIGAVSSEVVVQAGPSTIETQQAALSVTVSEFIKPAPGVAAKGSEKPQAMATPRLREHFPETLLWLPEVETGRNGRARLEVPLADNITTWKMATIASNLDGQIGVGEAEIRAFQPFFVEHDPPKVLTEGDEIALPVVMRNYLDKPLALHVEMKPEPWFTLSGAAQKRAQVAAGDFSREVFAFRAIASVKQGKQRVTAAGMESGDAIEKPVHVHPDGEERVSLATNLLLRSGTLALELPGEIIAGSLETQVKIYPNLATHVMESIEGILQRPYGCGEQTISSTYPNLLLLRYAKRARSQSALTQRAEAYLRQGYERLLGYRTAQGGFGYWGGQEADLALTAYAVRFLHDAREFIAVDKKVLEGAREYLVSRAGGDGRWQRYESNPTAASPATDMLTAYLVRILAYTAPSNGKDLTAGKAIELALEYLAPRLHAWDEPYLLANFALAAQRAGKLKYGDEATNRLRRMAQDEHGAAHWVLESSTPFHGWGLTGRIETAALVVQALAQAAARAESAREGAALDDELVQRGLLFLLRNKDRYGVWYSTQATVNVLDALLLLARHLPAAEGAAGNTVDVVVNGKPAGSVQLPPPNQLAAMLTVDISAAMVAGSNQVEIRGLGATPTTVQVVAAYYTPWKEKQVAAHPGASSLANDRAALALKVDYDRVTAGVGETIKCTVQAERIRQGGDGMMVAEVGLPPGADVDRAGLKKVVGDQATGVKQYDVLPDRVVLYLWPGTGGTTLSFGFKVRYGVRAKAAASVLYDYYNPEARVVVRPVSFVVQ